VVIVQQLCCSVRASHNECVTPRVSPMV